jgi:ABC-type uncharacterized transport system permease subunit
MPPLFWTSLRFPDMEFLDITLTKNLSFFFNAIHNIFYWRILKKTIAGYSSLGLKILLKNP